MDVHATRRDERVLRRIVALLVALALLAERAAARSWPVRCFVLCILRRAETAARGFVLDETGAPAPVEPIAAAVNGPAGALGLAARFRALATALGAMLPDAPRIDRRPAGHGFANGHLAPGSDRSPSGWTREPNDTS